MSDAMTKREAAEREAGGRGWSKRGWGERIAKIVLWGGLGLLVSHSQGVMADSGDMQKLKWSSDFRSRWESLDYAQDPSVVGRREQYDQLSMRARLASRFQARENLSLQFRLATGAGGTSTNSVYGDTVKGFRNPEFRLDRAHLMWKLPVFEVHAGRMVMVARAAGQNDMMWDSDLHWDGMAIRREFKAEDWRAGFAVAHAILSESRASSAASDARYQVAHLHASFRSSIGEWGMVLGEARTHGVAGLAAMVGTDFAGNSNAASAYRYEYQTQYLGVEWKALDAPLVMFAQIAQNAAVSDARRAQIVGARWDASRGAGGASGGAVGGGGASAASGASSGTSSGASDGARVEGLSWPLGWSLAWDYREVQADSTLGIFTDSETFGGGADGRSHRVVATVRADEDVNLVATYLWGESRISDPLLSNLARRRLMLDLVAEF